MKKNLLILIAVFIIGLIAWYFVGSVYHTQGPSAMFVSQFPAEAAKLHAEGLRLFHMGKLKEAIDAWLQELKLDPQNANTHNNIGMAYNETGDFTNSLKYHLKAVELDPGFGHGYYSLGIAYFECKTYEQAINAFNKSIELNYKPADSYYYLGHIYKDSQQCEKAIESYKKAVMLQPAYEKYVRLYIISCEQEMKNNTLIKFYKVIPCGDSKNRCIQPGTEPGAKVTLLGEKGVNTCTAMTGDGIVIEDDLGSEGATKLVELTCKDDFVYDIAVMNEVVDSYKRIELSIITDSSLVGKMDSEIKKIGVLNQFSGAADYKAEEFNEVPPKRVCAISLTNKIIYLAEYDSGMRQLTVINNDGSYALLSERNKLCSLAVGAFSINNRFYVKTLQCRCETDGCGDVFTEVK